MMKLAIFTLLVSASQAFMGTKLSTFGVQRASSLTMVADDAKVVLITGSSQGNAMKKPEPVRVRHPAKSFAGHVKNL